MVALLFALAVGSQQVDPFADLAMLERVVPAKAALTDPEVIAAQDRLIARIFEDRPADVTLRTELGKKFQANVDRATASPMHRILAGDPFAKVLCEYDDAEMLHEPVDHLSVYRDAATFPGEVPAGTPRIRVEQTVDLNVPGWHCLGAYAAPGEVVTIRVEGDAPKGLVAQIDGHTDNIARRPVWERPPHMVRRFPIRGGSTLIGSAFGGLVYVNVPLKAFGDLKVDVSNVVAAPMYTLGKTTDEEWKTERNQPAPWAELGTGKLVITVPSSVIRTLDDPKPLMEFWNQVLDADADLATIPHERARPERIMPDVEISAGYMHSGYPIMIPTSEAKNLVDLTKLHTGEWGFYHELGHNHQNRDWCFDGTVEVTVNLFSLYVNETLCGNDWLHSWSKGFHESPDRLKADLAAGKKPWEDGKDLALRLYMYVEEEHAFGWDSFKKVFAEYRALPKDQRPKNDDQKRDQWLVRYSRTVGKNLGPFFEAWGVPTSEAARDSIKDLPTWMPTDWPA
jgi:hypothetical protein